MIKALDTNRHLKNLDGCHILDFQELDSMESDRYSTVDRVGGWRPQNDPLVMCWPEDGKGC